MCHGIPEETDVNYSLEMTAINPMAAPSLNNGGYNAMAWAGQSAASTHENSSFYDRVTSEKATSQSTSASTSYETQVMLKTKVENADPGPVITRHYEPIHQNFNNQSYPMQTAPYPQSIVYQQLEHNIPATQQFEQLGGRNGVNGIQPIYGFKMPMCGNSLYFDNTASETNNHAAAYFKQQSYAYQDSNYSANVQPYPVIQPSVGSVMTFNQPMQYSTANTEHYTTVKGETLTPIISQPVNENQQSHLSKCLRVRSILLPK